MYNLEINVVSKSCYTLWLKMNNASGAEAIHVASAPPSSHHGLASLSLKKKKIFKERRDASEEHRACYNW